MGPPLYNAGDLKILGSIAAQAADAIEVARLGRELKAGTRKPVNLIYGVDERPPAVTSVGLGLQHVLIALMSLAYPVLVTLEAGGSRVQAAAVVSVSLLAMAFATMLQVARRGPVGSGFLAPYITSVIFLAPSVLAARQGGLALVSGMTVLAGAVGLVLAQVLRRFRKLFPPEVSGVVVLVVGLSLVPMALPRFLGIGGIDAVSQPAELLVGVLTLGTIVALTVLPLGKVRLYAAAIGIAVGYAASAAFGLLDAASFESLRKLPTLGWQPITLHELTFDPLLAIPFAVAALALSIKDAGMVISCQKTNDAQWRRPDMGSVSGGIVASGLGNIAAGALGAVGLGISAGNVALAAASGATARVIGVVVAALFVILAFMPKVTATLALMPSPVIGAGLLFVACHLISSGAELITSRMLDARRNYVVGLPLLAGVGLMVAPGLLAGAPAWAQAGLGSPLALATILAPGLNLALNVGISNRAQLRVPADAAINDAVARFFERQGASWGARSDVIRLIRRAAPAVIEWCEELRQLGVATEAGIDLQFDEFPLVAIIRANAGAVPTPTREDSDVAHALDRAARTVERRYGCKVKIASRADVTLSFEH
ncbi:MAG: purine/pyrimidine permease [Burkholderiales bacterium]|nr:purine/pyrimidine permease [Burkholderiales bacterium]